ncbi:ABC transporter permease [Streptacidiphilus sp. 4-A2]|nr:ABC transporter permease [Streptacidiphilus sp. 4-A2]
MVGTIGQAGLLGPAQLSFVLGGAHLSFAAGAVRIDHYGHHYPGKPLDPMLVLLCLVGFVVLLAPAVAFLGTAARFGGEQRDRRLAAIRLCGADRAMTARVAAGEALAGAVLGLAAGVLLFQLGRSLAPHFSVQGVSFFSQDISPQPLLAALIMVLVPLLAVVVTLLAVRRVGLDPLGTVRRAADRRRRLWWRLLLPFTGLAVLLWEAPESGTVPGDVGLIGYGMATVPLLAGLVLLLVGVGVLLPWLVGALTRRLGRPAVLAAGGAPAPARRHGLRQRGRRDHGRGRRGDRPANVLRRGRPLVPAARAARCERRLPGRGDPPRWRARAADRAPARHAGRTPGARLRPGAVAAAATPGRGGTLSAMVNVVVGDCATLRAFAPLPHCADGDFFAARAGGGQGSPADDPTKVFAAGTRVGFGLTPADNPGPVWRLPAVTAAVTAGADPLASSYEPLGRFLATPGAVPAALLRTQNSTVYVDYDQGRPDGADQVRTAAALLSPTATVTFADQQAVDHNFSIVSRGLAFGVALTLLLVAASLLVGLLEQLRERRRILAVLYAFGTPRSVVALSVLWQSLLPMALGLLLATAGGLALGAVLLQVSQLPMAFDWGAVALLAASGGLSALLVAGLSLPPLLRMMRPGELRHE